MQLSHPPAINPQNQHDAPLSQSHPSAYNLSVANCYKLMQIQAEKLYAQSLSTTVCPMLLEPFIRWQSVENMSDVILHKFEALLQRVDVAIKHKNSDFSELIEVKNILVVSYILITECLSKGISSSVLAYHLVIYRHMFWSTLAGHFDLRFFIANGRLIAQG